jgi:hypothetical protein
MKTKFVLLTLGIFWLRKSVKKTIRTHDRCAKKG